jgi:acyl phosphate:glycerol-3-phosphate acyltransferase
VVASGWIIVGAVIAVAYLLGTVPSAQLVAARAGHDPTREGSNNPGASNVYRLAGRRAGAIVLGVDLGKGVAATLLGLTVGGRPLALAAGAAAVFGHIAPVTRRLRGGKGVATAGGMALVLWPVVSLALLALFVVLASTVRIASVGSIAMAAGLPVGVALAASGAEEVAVATGVAVLVVSRHHENIARLIRGEERPTASEPDRPTEPTP